MTIDRSTEIFFVAMLGFTIGLVVAGEHRRYDAPVPVATAPAMSFCTCPPVAFSATISPSTEDITDDFPQRPREEIMATKRLLK